MGRYIITVDTEKVGTTDYAYVESDWFSAVEDYAEDLAYDNFQNYFTVEDYADYLGTDDYEDDDIYSLFGYDIEEFTGSDEEWEDHRSIIVHLPN